MVDRLQNFEVIGTRGYLRPSSFLSIDHAAELVDAAISVARAQGVSDVLADVRALAGFPSPTVKERFYIVSKWARTAGSHVRLAVVACQEHIDPRKFGVTVAMNRGLVGNIFNAEPDAIRWLDSLPLVKPPQQ